MVGNFLSQFLFDTLVAVAQVSATLVALAGMAYLLYLAWRLF